MVVLPTPRLVFEMVAVDSRVNRVHSFHSWLQADESGEDLRELTVEGTTFDPTIGHVHGLSHLDRNLEVCPKRCHHDSLLPGIRMGYLPISMAVSETHVSLAVRCWCHCCM